MVCMHVIKDSDFEMLVFKEWTAHPLLIISAKIRNFPGKKAVIDDDSLLYDFFFLFLVTNETDHINRQCLGHLQQTDNGSIL